MFHLKSKLRFLKLPHAALLHVELGEEQGGADASSTGADAAEDERPAEPVVGVARHPLVAVAEAGEDYHAQPGTNASAQQDVRRDLKLKAVERLSAVETQFRSNLYHQQEMLLIRSTAEEVQKHQNQ